MASSRKAKGVAGPLYGSRRSGPIKRDWGGASAMLDLRAVYINGDWEALQQHRIKQECHRLYPYRAFVQ